MAVVLDVPLATTAAQNCATAAAAAVALAPGGGVNTRWSASDRLAAGAPANVASASLCRLAVAVSLVHTPPAAAIVAGSEFVQDGSVPPLHVSVAVALHTLAVGGGGATSAVERQVRGAGDATAAQSTVITSASLSRGVGSTMSYGSALPASTAAALTVVVNWEAARAVALPAAHVAHPDTDAGRQTPCKSHTYSCAPSGRHVPFPAPPHSHRTTAMLPGARAGATTSAGMSYRASRKASVAGR